MKIVKQLEIYARIFFIILGFTTIATSVFIYAFSINPIDNSLFWQLILFSVLSTLFCSIYYLNSLFGKMHLYVKIAIQFLLNTATLLAFAYFYKWIQFDNVRSLLLMILLAIGGYAVVAVVIFLNEFLQARKLNVKLSEYKRNRGKSDE